MTLEEVVSFVESLGAVLTVSPGPLDGAPEIAWGDVFFYYSPDGAVPRAQPFATIVTKDYPGEPGSGLNRPGAFRVNVGVDPALYREWTGRDRREEISGDVDFTAQDVVLPHPTYGRQGWLAVVTPGVATQDVLRELLRAAHARAKAHAERHPR